MAGVLGDVGFLAMFVLTVEWMIAYHVSTGGAWAKSRWGIHLMSMAGAIAICAGLATSVLIVVDWMGRTGWVEGYPYLRVACVYLIVAMIGWRRYLLFDAQLYPGGNIVKVANLAATQVQKPKRTVVRTVFQAIVSLAAGAPLIYTAVAQEDPALATGGFGTALVVAGAITRVMALPFVEEFLQKYVPWLSAEDAQYVDSSELDPDLP